MWQNTKGKGIEGLTEASEISGITIFHAGTKFEDGQYYTNGGRVLGVCASESKLAETMGKIYEAISHINFEAAHYRRDIGAAREEGSCARGPTASLCWLRR